MLTQHNNSNREQRTGQQQVEKLATSLTSLWESKQQNNPPPPSPRKLLFLMKHEIDFKHRHYEPCLASRPITCFVTKFQTIFIIS